MINNARAALPHNGIANFDVVYELPVEGASTRLMALTADYRQAPRYGSLRSARHDFVELASAADAVLVHWGGSDFAYNAISRYGVDHLDGMTYGERYFITDRSLGRALEHTRFIEPDGLSQGLAAVSANLTQEGYPSLFAFNQAGITAGDIAANQVTVPATGEITATFTYDPGKGQYAKGEFGSTETDGNTGETVYVDNAFVLYTSVSLMEDGVHKDVGLSSGSGYYISKGTAQSISWSKGNAGDRLTFTDASGRELLVNPGKSWIIFTGSSPSRTQFFLTQQTKIPAAARRRKKSSSPPTATAGILFCLGTAPLLRTEGSHRIAFGSFPRRDQAAQQGQHHTEGNQNNTGHHRQGRIDGGCPSQGVDDGVAGDQQ